jgi:glycosyltransferase involved in cell wall biosynthesis
VNPGDQALHVVHALFFFPRGGSAQVARSLTAALPEHGVAAALASGSLGGPGDLGHAPTFFRRTDVATVDYTPAAGLADPLAAPVPFQPSFEDRPGSPDRVFAAVGDEPYERLVEAWAGALERAGAGAADVLHLHHLTPAHEAALRAFPDVPRVSQLHGTEVAMLRAIETGAPPSWRHADAWAARLCRWAAASARLLASPTSADEMARLVGVPRRRFTTVGNGVDTALFDRRPLCGEARLDLWRRWLVAEPRGWDRSGVPGSVAYGERDLEAFAGDAPAFLFVGRYTEVKRLPWLIETYALASRRFATRAPLVVVGGYPGEWEGEHPLETIRRTGARDVFLAGWHGHDDLPRAFGGADVLVLPSRHEAFGIVLIEAMASGLPTIACDVPGPSGIVDAGETGWLVGRDDTDALADALVEAVNRPDERRRRGDAAYRASRRRYGWSAVAGTVARVYGDLARPPCERGRGRHAAPRAGASTGTG